MKIELFAIVFLSLNVLCFAQLRKFEVDHITDTFLMDGQEFRYVAGSFHYFRAHPDTWQDKLRKMRAGGLNAVDIYIQWSLHNPKDGVYNWEGIANITRFIELATEEDLYVILRPGPYICAEIDNGGLPYWLATKYPNIQVRTNDRNYLNEVEKWYNQLMPLFENHWYGKGGKIIMVQVENEYGAFKVCEQEYKEFLRDLTLKFTREDAVLFTCDRPYDNELKCGYIENVFVTTDFGLANETEVAQHFDKLREIQPTGPLVNSEFYTGWLTHWQEGNARRDGKQLAETLRIMLRDYKASVNFYMYFGGTNFGFWAGANDWGIGRYMADITSYDYDAPLTEPGDLAPKYYDFRAVIGDYLQLPPLALPDPSKKTKYPSITLTPVNNILSTNGRSILGSEPKQTGRLLTFEELDQFSGFVLYETTIPKQFTRDPAELTVEKLRDRAHVYVDGKLAGVLSRENSIKSLPLNMGTAGKKLSILVENQGRINFQENFDFKGILGNVSIQEFHEPYYRELSDWTITGFPFEDYSKIEQFMATEESGSYELHKNGWLKEGPVLFSGNFTIPDGEEVTDTWWHVQGWGKGTLFVNGFNLGRYWSVGPQLAQYIPKEHLNQGYNSIVVLELQKAPTDLHFNFSDKADYNEGEN